MEEKLYFKPANYGKGKKKKQIEQRVETSAAKKKDHRALKLVCLLLFLLAFAAIIVWLLRGKTTTSGRFPENVNNESLTCVAAHLIPPKLDAVNSNDKEIKINAIFKGEDELKNISLVYTLNYTDSDQAYGAEAKAHAELNKSLSASGYSTDKFSNKFARYDDRLIISLTASHGEITEISAPYFMILLSGDRTVELKTIRDYQKNYEVQGFSCTNTLNQ